ncbi:MAG: hypothetical protein FWF51_09405 [Chitinivibrionia bacterium]|nr:hypothetical protein [Chitinivibrionia bacterium]
MKRKISLLSVFLLSVCYSQLKSGPIAKLPPHPGAAGKKTILGIDSDGDGIRDDIQIAITKLIPDDPYVRAGAMFAFKMHQELFKTFLSDTTQSFEKLYPYFMGISAGNKYWITCKTEDVISDDEYDVLWYNTKERFLLSEKIDDLANGKAFQVYEDYPEYKEKYDKEFQKVYEREMERQK